MEIVRLENIDVRGIGIRTDNVSEMNATTAKIGSLWAAFYSELAPALGADAKVFGLYTNYESDHTGAFDVVACSDRLNAENLDSFHIHSGSYLQFKGAGEMPQAVIDLWGKVWNYFASENCKYKRAFTTDFELYKSENQIEIYIAVVDGI